MGFVLRRLRTAIKDNIIFWIIMCTILFIGKTTFSCSLP
jgi:hypothetical protein